MKCDLSNSCSESDSGFAGGKKKNSWRTKNARTSLLEASISSCSWQKLKNGQNHFPLRAQSREKASFPFQWKYAYIQMWSHIQVIIKTQLNVQLWATCVGSLSSVKEGILSQACLKCFWSYFILSAFYWVFGVRKLRSKGHTDGTISSQDTVRKTKGNVYYFYRLWTNVENVSLKNSRYTQSMHWHTITCWEKSNSARFSVKKENASSEAAASSLSNDAITKHLCKSVWQSI